MEGGSKERKDEELGGEDNLYYKLIQPDNSPKQRLLVRVKTCDTGAGFCIENKEWYFFVYLNMKSAKLISVLSIVLVLLTSCHNLVDGRGSIVESNTFFDTSSTVHFTEIEVNADCNVFLKQRDYSEVTIMGYENLVPYVHAYHTNNRYVIELTEDVVFLNNNIYIHITSPVYTKIILNSQSSIHSLDSINNPILDVTNNGSGTISLFGEANIVTAYSAGSGMTRLCALEADTVNAFMLGSGVLSTKPINKLNAQIQGSGQIQYIGSPTLNFTNSGSGSLLQTLGCY